VKDLAKTGDAEKRMMICEYGLQVRQESAHGIVADLTTSGPSNASARASVWRAAAAACSNSSLVRITTSAIFINSFSNALRFSLSRSRPCSASPSCALVALARDARVKDSRHML
jgi:hypothetical protein